MYEDCVHAAVVGMGQVNRENASEISGVLRRWWVDVEGRGNYVYSYDVEQRSLKCELSNLHSRRFYLHTSHPTQQIPRLSSNTPIVKNQSQWSRK
jgi:hypothetical protein